MDTAEREAMLTLLLTPGLGQTLVGRCVEAFGSAQATLDQPAARLTRLRGITARTCDALRRTREDGEVERELAVIEKHGARLIALGEDAYPKLLGHIPDPPRLLWVRGELRADDALALAVVGSRKCTHYGREQAERFARGAAQAGLCIVSGGAYGIDAAAHHAALSAGGRTIAVLGSGLGKPYPKENVELFRRIVSPPGSQTPGSQTDLTGGTSGGTSGGGGAVVSEFPMLTPPRAENFPRRNRIISGLSLGVLLIEAARRSGALITARLCVEEHGRELLAVPGRVDSPSSAGCHQAIREGWATLATSLADVLDALGEAGQVLKASMGSDTDAPGQAGGGSTAPAYEEKLSDDQRAIVDGLSEPRSLDELTAAIGLPVHKVQAELTMLEVRGTVKREQGLFVARRRK